MIARIQTKICLVQMMESYIKLASVHVHITGPPRSPPFLQYCTLKEWSLAKSYGLHSLRPGGATAAAYEGMPDRSCSMVAGEVRTLKMAM